MKRGERRKVSSYFIPHIAERTFVRDRKSADHHVIISGQEILRSTGRNHRVLRGNGRILNNFVLVNV